jgi:3-oxoacyl-[acyl-carrier-protein] synthase-1
MSEASGDLVKFGAELSATVNPMWLLRSLPNNVLCHVGIIYGLKGTNACITNHCVGGMLAVIEAMCGLRAGEADYAVAIGHDAPIEPQYLLYYQGVGLTARDALRPFDAARDGSLFGEGAGALVLESEAAARARGATLLGEVLGGGSAAEAEGLFAIRDDGAGVVAAIEAAMADAGIGPAEVGLVLAHGNGTRASDASEARALRAVFGKSMPPVTASKWSIGHLLSASGAIDSVLALQMLRRGKVPGIATLEMLDPEFPDLAVAKHTTPPRSDIALVISRGFGSTNAALLIRGSRD